MGFDAPFASRSVVAEDSAFGEVVPLGNGEFYFYGMVREVLRLMINQSHNAIVSFRALGAGRSALRHVTARVPEDELAKAGIAVADLPKVQNSPRRELQMIGTLTTTSGGHVLGIVRRPTDDEVKIVQRTEWAEKFAAPFK